MAPSSKRPKPSSGTRLSWLMDGLVVALGFAMKLLPRSRPETDKAKTAKTDEATKTKPHAGEQK